MSDKLFPNYLNQGSKGPAVNVLGLLMVAAGYGKLGDIVLDGDYTPDGKISKAVKRFQEDYSLKDVDGNFGPETRKEFYNQTGIDVDALTVDMFTGETVAASPAVAAA